jgi:hypothetical protein
MNAAFSQANSQAAAAAAGPVRAAGRIDPKGAISLGRSLKLVQLPAAPPPLPGTDPTRPAPAVDSWIGRRIQYQLVPSTPAEEIAITNHGLVTGYGIFGAPGTGKTRLVMHILKQVLNDVGKESGDEKFGGLILDPKAAMLDDVSRMWKELGPHRRDDLVIIKPDQMNEEGRSLNVIDSALTPVELGRMLVLAAQSAGVAAKEPFWFLAWTNMFGAALTIYEYYERKAPTLKQLMDAILLPGISNRLLDAPGRNGMGQRRKRRIEEMAEALSGDEGEQEIAKIHSGIGCIPLEQIRSDVRAAAAQIESFFQSDYVRTLEAFMTNAFGYFQSHRFRCLSKGSRSLVEKYGGARSRPSFYDEVIEHGKVILVSMGPEDPGMGKVLCTLVKCLFQQSVMSRRERYLAGKLSNFKRPLFIACDEYAEIASEVPGQPMGDGRFFSLARENGCMGVLATQSIHTLENSSLKESWKSIFSNLASKIFMGASDNETAKQAAELAGEIDWEMSSTSVSYGRENSFSKQANVQQRPEMPPYILTHVLKQRQAVSIGSLDGRDSPPVLQFFEVPRSGA